MLRVYTDRWNSFQFRAPNYIDGHFEPYIFDLVKWEKREKPIEVTDDYTGKKKMSKEYCFSIGQLKWDPKDRTFKFESCRLRYLEHRIDGLEAFILAFCKSVEMHWSRNKEND